MSGTAKISETVKGTESTSKEVEKKQAGPIVLVGKGVRFSPRMNVVTRQEEDVPEGLVVRTKSEGTLSFEKVRILKERCGERNWDDLSKDEQNAIKKEFYDEIREYIRATVMLGVMKQFQVKLYQAKRVPRVDIMIDGVSMEVSVPKAEEGDTPKNYVARNNAKLTADISALANKYLNDQNPAALFESIGIEK